MLFLSSFFAEGVARIWRSLIFCSCDLGSDLEIKVHVGLDAAIALTLGNVL